MYLLLTSPCGCWHNNKASEGAPSHIAVTSPGGGQEVGAVGAVGWPREHSFITWHVFVIFVEAFPSQHTTESHFISYVSEIWDIIIMLIAFPDNEIKGCSILLSPDLVWAAQLSISRPRSDVILLCLVSCVRTSAPNKNMPLGVFCAMEWRKWGKCYRDRDRDIMNLGRQVQYHFSKYYFQDHYHYIRGAWWIFDIKDFCFHIPQVEKDPLSRPQWGKFNEMKERKESFLTTSKKLLQWQHTV